MTCKVHQYKKVNLKLLKQYKMLKTIPSAFNEKISASNYSINNLQSAYIGSTLWLIVCLATTFATIFGNLLTITALCFSRKLNTVKSNRFVCSLAISDLLVGLSMPYHMCFYLGGGTGYDYYFSRNKYPCLIRFALISLTCSSSVTKILTVAADRYIAILYPLQYHNFMTRRNSYCLIGGGWMVSLALGIVPIYWNNWKEGGGVMCDTELIMPAEYFNFVLTPMFALDFFAMFIVYFKIWKEAHRHAQRMKVMQQQQGSQFVLSNANDTKSIQVVMLTLGSFSICWLPYFIVTTYYRISNNSSKFSLLYEIAFTMAVGNSGMNPIIYAWKNSNFREAFRCLLTCQSPNKSKKHTNYITNHIPSTHSKKSSMSNGQTTQEQRDVGGHENLAIDIELNNRYNINKEEDFDRECSVSTDVTNA